MAGSSRRSLNSLDEESSVQLTPSQEFGEHTPLVGGLNGRPIPRLNKMQQAAGGLVAWIDPTFSMIVGTAITRYYDIEAPSPGYYPATAGAWVVLGEASKVARAYATQESPHRYLRAAGGGSFAVGLAREISKKALVLAGIEGMWIGLNFLRQHYYDIAIADPEKFQALILVLSYLDSPSARNASVALITAPIYWGGQKILGCCCWPTPDVPPEENPDTRWYQKLTHEGVRIFYGVVAGEVVREVMNTVVGYAVQLHVEDSMMFSFPLVFLIRDPLDYYSRMPRPIATLDVPCLERRRARAPSQNLLDDEAEPEVHNPGKCRNAMGLSIRLAVVVMAFGVVFGLNRVLMRGLTDLNCTENNVNPIANQSHTPDQLGRRSTCETDPADLDYAERMGLAAVLTGAGILFQKMVLEGPSAIRHLCNRFGMYRRNQAAPANNRVEVLPEEPKPEQETQRLN